MDVNKIKLSVIIPMYNCAEVITRCLDSIDYSEAEIIVVDDGSKDNGAVVVTKYAELRPNVRLIQKENGGPSSARNLGIGAAHGEYIMFVDADDYLLSGGIAQMVDLAIQENADVVKYLIKHVSNTDPIMVGVSCASEVKIRKIVGQGEVLQYYDISDYHVVDALFKRELIVKNEIQFRTDLHLQEDDTFMGEVYSCAEKVISTDLFLYVYIHASAQSSTHHQNAEKTKKLIDSAKLAIQYRSEAIKRNCPNHEFPLEKYKYMRYVIGCQRSMVAAKYPYAEYKSVLNEFKKLGCWPISYKWIKVAQRNYTFKEILKTWYCNHLWVYGIMRMIKG